MAFSAATAIAFIIGPFALTGGLLLVCLHLAETKRLQKTLQKRKKQ